jgi:hypothetical protein
MPKKYQMRRYRPVKLRMKGRGRTWNKIKNWLSGANRWLRKNKILSGLAGVYGKTGLPYAKNIGYAGEAGKILGYGKRKVIRRRRRMTGSALAPVGGAMASAGLAYGRR